MNPKHPRKPRLSQRETERRMLQAAVAAVDFTGLTVSLEHLSFEAVIASAKVSRAAAYRRWPNKEQFLGDLIRELARATVPAAEGMASAAAVIGELVRPQLPRLADPEQRGAAAVDIMRAAADRDFWSLYSSTQWRTYLAVSATFAGLPDGALRSEVQEVLAVAQRGFVDRLAGSWEKLASVLGFRLRDGLPGFETLAALLHANLRGLILMALANPDLAESRVEADPFRTGSADWSAASLDCALIAVGFLELDPSATWEHNRVDALLGGLELAQFA